MSAEREPKEQKGTAEGYALVRAILTITIVGAAFWWVAWLILDAFGA